MDTTKTVQLLSHSMPDYLYMCKLEELDVIQRITPHTNSFVFFLGSEQSARPFLQPFQRNFIVAFIGAMYAHLQIKEDV
jgi:hypothetical protein